MKAAIIEQAGKLAVRDVPEPAIGAYEARCDILYGTLCAGTDTHLLHWDQPFSKWLTPPYILGHESIGRVVETGPGVRNYKPGDRITRVGCPPLGEVGSGWGGFAEVGVATDWRAMQEDGVEGWQGKTVNQILPPDIDPAVGTLFITWRETLSYVTRMGIGPGARVLIIGSGGNGLAFVANARNLGADRIVLVGSAGRLDDAKRAGAAECFDYRDPSCWDRVKAAEPDGFNYVIDAVGRAEGTIQGQRCLTGGGTIGVYGMDDYGNVRLETGKTFTFYGGGYNEAEAHDAVLKFYRAGCLNPSIWINREKAFALTDIACAFDAIKQRLLVKPLIRIRG